MRQRHVAGAVHNARDILQVCGIRIGSRFDDLSAEQLARLEREADRARFWTGSPKIPARLETFYRRTDSLAQGKAWRRS